MKRLLAGYFADLLHTAFVLCLVAYYGMTKPTMLFVTSLVLVVVGKTLSWIWIDRNEPEFPAKTRSNQVPRHAEFLLYLLLDKNDRSAVTGDLEEEFTTVVSPKFGLRLAQVWYWKQVICSIPPVVWTSLRRLATIGTLAVGIRRFLKWL